MFKTLSIKLFILFFINTLFINAQEGPYSTLKDGWGKWINCNMKAWSVNYSRSNLRFNGVENNLTSQYSFLNLKDTTEIPFRNYTEIYFHYERGVKKLSLFTKELKVPINIGYSLGILFPNQKKIDLDNRSTYNFFYKSNNPSYDSYWLAINYTYFNANFFLLFPLIIYKIKNFSILAEPTIGFKPMLCLSSNQIDFKSDNSSNQTYQYFKETMKPTKILLGMNYGLNFKIAVPFEDDSDLFLNCSMSYFHYFNDAIRVNYNSKESNSQYNRLSSTMPYFSFGVGWAKKLNK